MRKTFNSALLLTGMKLRRRPGVLRRVIATLVVICLAASLFAVSAMAQSGKRLVLKDGTWQGIVQYEVKGDRVRYLSSERGEWEELPNSLVDWKATNEWNSGPKPKSSAELAQAEAEEEADRKAEEAQTPTIAAGIKLPFQGGVFLLDRYRGQPQLIELSQNGGELNKDVGRNILRAAINPVASAKQTVELKTPHARVQSHVPAPEIYIDVEQESQGKPVPVSERFRMVRLDSKKDARVLQSTSITFYGKASQKQNFIPARTEKFSGDWVRVVPAETLKPGEYALVEMLNEKDMNIYVWDFGVNSLAPENPGAWKPEPAQTSPAPLHQ